MSRKATSPRKKFPCNLSHIIFLLYLIYFLSNRSSHSYPRYESKGRQLAKSKPAYPVGMSPAAIALQQNTSKDGKPTIPGLAPSAAKQVKKKKKKNNCQDEAVQEVSAKMVAFTIQEPDFGQPVKTKKGGTEPKTETPCPNAGVSASTDPAKKLKNLKKKLRDTEVLEEKIKKGELKNPDKDQLEKIKRKKDVLKEIQELEKQVN